MNEPSPPLAGRREWIGLAVLLLPLLLVSMDVSVLYFAVPFISADLAPTATQQLWIFDIYGFVLAGLLITMGALGDRIGRRRLLMIGAAAFALTSAAAAYAGSAEALIATRALLGIGGATLMPSTLALIRNMFHDAKQRATAIAIWTAALTFGVALGPILSGVLLEHFWWGSVFLINVPFMLLLVVLVPVLVPESRRVAGGRFDLLGAVLSLAAVLPVIWGVKELAAEGDPRLAAAAIVLGLAVGAAFLHRQRSSPDPLIDLTMFRGRAFRGAVAVNLLAMFALIGFAIFTTQLLQTVWGMSPLEAALWSLVPSLGIGAVAPLAAGLAQRGIPRNRLVAVGFLVALAGFAAMTAVGADSPLWTLMVCASLYACGLVVVMSLSAELILWAAPPERAGSASALSETAAEFGGALGMAVLGSIGTAVFRARLDVPAGLPAEAADTARETLAGAAAVAAGLPGDAGAALLAGARTAFMSGLHAAAIAAAVLMALAAALALRTLRGSDSGPVSPTAADCSPHGAGSASVARTDADARAGADAGAGAAA
ncbi:MFS transporter [Catellatospora coxensis]|uniref:MFS transporter n=1 Tax=Catellatospora coxensis TaxID=310354 RepID=A0A8J3KY02_9ACTN|nr:MFS transporter [Catellatospora coxensis]GIG07484.1 MFS transporter [Catellatospora coxensis]